MPRGDLTRASVRRHHHGTRQRRRVRGRAFLSRHFRKRKWLRKRFAYAGRSVGPMSRTDSKSSGRAGVRDRRHAAKRREEGGRPLYRDPGDSREHCLPYALSLRLSPLRLYRPIAGGMTNDRVLRELMEPVRGFQLIERPDDRHAVAEDLQTNAAHRCWGQRPVLQIVSLEQKVRRGASMAQISDLAPQAPVDYRQVQAPSRLSLHEQAVWESVVAGREPFSGDLDAAFSERSRHPVDQLPGVDRDSANCSHARRQSVQGWRPGARGERLL